MNTKLKYPVITQSELRELLNENSEVYKGLHKKTPFVILNNKIITNIYIDKVDGSSLIFCTNEGQYTDDKYIEFNVTGDCCSESWFSDFFGLNNLLNEKVLFVTEIYLDDTYECDNERSRQSFDQVYGYKFVTNKGCAVLSFRNSSNGYYGGNCYCSGEINSAHVELGYPLDISKEGVWQSNIC